LGSETLKSDEKPMGFSPTSSKPCKHLLHQIRRVWGSFFLTVVNQVFWPEPTNNIPQQSPMSQIIPPKKIRENFHPKKNLPTTLDHRKKKTLPGGKKRYTPEN